MPTSVDESTRSSARLYRGEIGYLTDKALAWTLAAIGPAWIALGAAIFASGVSLTTFETAGLALLVVLGGFETAVATPRALRKALAHDRHSGPYIEVDLDTLRFVEGPGHVLSVPRSRVRRCEHRYRLDNPYARASRISLLRMFDGDGNEVAMWSIWPLWGRAVTRWLRRQGIDAVVRST